MEKKIFIYSIIVHKKSSVVRTCGSKIGTKTCYKTAGMNNV
jgi:hypothetical protein